MSTTQTSAELVIVRINLDSRFGGVDREGRSVSAVRCRLATRYTPGSKVEFEEGVTMIRGGFPPRGGSRQNPALNWEPGTILEVEDVAEDAARWEVEECYGVTIIGNDHTERCAEECAQARKWRRDHPGYCRVCDGAGGSNVAGVRYYADGSGEPDLWEACEGCVAVGRCPWCRSKLFVKWEESGLYRCIQSLKCGWDECGSDRAPLAAWECVCWEDEVEAAEVT